MNEKLFSRSLAEYLGRPTLQVKLDPQSVHHLSVILDRYEKICATPINRNILAMDLTIVHSNGCPLDFQRFATHQNDVEFSCNVAAIQNLIDRSTGKLRNGFVPMFALKGN